MQGADASRAVYALSLLADPARRPFDASKMVAVFAHPDDETLGLGAQLRRMVGLSLVIVTDGAPRSLVDARSHGFADAESYAAARRTELAGALGEAGARQLHVRQLGFADQSVALALPDLARQLLALLDGMEVVFTHAYEGGHPDHDGVAFAVHAACALLPENARPEIIESPFYRQGEAGEFLPQSFEPLPGTAAIQVPLSEEEAAIKARMVAAHVTQADVLAPFSLHDERFRNAPAHAFDVLPNGGRLWYERFDWRVDGPGWLARVAQARRELFADGAP